MFPKQMHIGSEFPVSGSAESASLAIYPVEGPVLPEPGLDVRLR